MGADLGMIAQGVGATTGVVGALMQNTRRKQQMADQQKLMGLQQGNQMALNQQGAELAKENWDYTNYENQVKHMENAGLNVGMMYGGSGQGGTLSSGSGGSASSGNAPTQNNEMGIMGLQLAQLANQTELTKAQIQNVEADTEKKKVEAGKLGGVDTENTKANTALTKMNTANAELQNNIGNKTIDEVVSGVKANADKAQSEARQELVKANVDENTQKATENKIKAEAINEAFKLVVMKSGIKLNEAQIKNMAEQIAIGKFNANTNAEFQGLDKVAGSQLNKLINEIYNVFGVEHNTQKTLK